MQLKEQYLQLQQNLTQLSKESEVPFLVRPRTKLMTSHSNNEPIDRAQLQALIKQTIEAHGGSCHLETLVEYIRKLWPKANKSDGTPYSSQDYKNRAEQVLKEKASIFVRDASSEWTVNSEFLEIENISEVMPLSEKITLIVEDEDFSCTAQTILAQVQEQWILPKCKGQKKASEEEVKEAVAITLETNPRFQYDAKNPENYSVKKRNRKTPNPAKKRKREDINLSSDSERELPNEPPPGFKCTCGATTPGKTITAKWRIDSQGQFKCISCYGKNKRASTKPTNAKKKKRPMEEHAEPSGPWIQCDRCNAWVAAHSDNIHDISLYDDSNPHHLDYFCPDCRAKQNGETPRKSLQKNESNFSWRLMIFSIQNTVGLL